MVMNEPDPVREDQRPIEQHHKNVNKKRKEEKLTCFSIGGETLAECLEGANILSLMSAKSITDDDLERAAILLNKKDGLLQEMADRLEQADQVIGDLRTEKERLANGLNLVKINYSKLEEKYEALVRASEALKTDLVKRETESEERLKDIKKLEAKLKRSDSETQNKIRELEHRKAEMKSRMIELMQCEEERGIALEVKKLTDELKAMTRKIDMFEDKFEDFTYNIEEKFLISEDDGKKATKELHDVHDAVDRLGRDQISLQHGIGAQKGTLLPKIPVGHDHKDVEFIQCPHCSDAFWFPRKYSQDGLQCPYCGKAIAEKKEKNKT